MRRKIMAKLVEWKNQTNQRMPLLLQGARQTGKTYSLNEFAQQYYTNSVYVNFEKEQRVREYLSTTLDTKEILRFLSQYYRCDIQPNTTLILYDEVQTCPEAITSLKYFCEDANDYHIIAAGSLLGVALHREHISFPVGKVWMETMYPMDFEEFLMAYEEDQLIDLIRSSFYTHTSLPESWHMHALHRYEAYLITGGMPAVVLSTIQNIGIGSEMIRQTIIDSYLADMAKYASAQDTMKIRKAYRSIPQQLSKENKKFQYKLIERNASSKKFEDALDCLQESGIILKCQKVKNDFLPMKAYVDEAFFKIYMSDVGLLSSLYDIDLQVLSLPEFAIFKGALAENYVAQQLSAMGYPLYYYHSEGKAELDFMMQGKYCVLPLEVKAGTNTKAKSLQEYCKKYQPPLVFRISQKQMGIKGHICSLPLYALFCLDLQTVTDMVTSMLDKRKIG